MKWWLNLNRKLRWAVAIWASLGVLPAVIWGAGALVPVVRTDLDAQRSMAIAAWAMFEITVVSLVVGLATLIFLAINLQLGRETAEHAERSARAAEDAVLASREGIGAQLDLAKDVARAYLTVTDISFALDVSPRISLRYFNAGQTPAKRIEIRLKLDVHIIDKTGKNLSSDRDAFEFVQLVDLPNGRENGTSSEYAVSVWRLIKDIAPAQRARVFVTGVIRYEDVFGREQGEKFTFGKVLRPDDLNADHKLESIPD